jgi:hypothetical protein
VSQDSKWQRSEWYTDGKGLLAPACPVCSKPLRKEGAKRKTFSNHGVAHLPWNASWDGKCESCGNQFGFKAVDVDLPRVLEVKPATRFYRQTIDSGIAVSGVEIRTVESSKGKPAAAATIFVSMDELQELLGALRGELKVVFDQFDWSEDWT